MKDLVTGEAPILPFPFKPSQEDERRRPRAALRPLTKPGTEQLPRAPEPSVPEERKTSFTVRDRRAAPDDEWKELEQLGLAPKPKQPRFARLLVSTYRLLGFAILTTIVVVLVSYLANAVFFYLDHSWIAPVTVSSNDERVVQARTALLASQDQRDRTAAELAQAERAITAHRAFQVEFAGAIKGDRDDRKATLARLRALAGSAAVARNKLARTTDEYAKQYAQRIEQESAAGLIDRTAELGGKYQLGQIAGANLSLAERQAEYEMRAAEIANEMRALEAIVERDRETGAPQATALSYEVLKIKREYEASRLELAKAMADRELLATSLERQDKAIAALEDSPFLRAASEDATVAMVPYANLEGLAPNAPVYACRLSFVACRKVGSVKEIMRGEVSFKHPRRETHLRGQMVELQLTDAAAVKQDVLFVGGQPLLF